MKRRLFLCSLAGPAGRATHRFAQSRPLRTVVPFAPGGAADIAARALQEPAVRERLTAQGPYACGSSSKDFSRQIAREIDRMKRIADVSRIRID